MSAPFSLRPKLSDEERRVLFCMDVPDTLARLSLVLGPHGLDRRDVLSVLQKLEKKGYVYSRPTRPTTRLRLWWGIRGHGAPFPS